MYGWGDGSMGQTGLERCDMNPVPQRIPAFENRSIASLAAGGNSSVAVSGAPLKRVFRFLISVLESVVFSPDSYIVPNSSTKRVCLRF